ncbi:MAG: DUF6559 family protein [Pseudomonadales bacterium]
MLAGFFRRRRIKKLARKLPLVLKKDIGKRKYYSQQQVDQVLRKKRFSRRDNSAAGNCPAYAMYCSPSEFERIHREAGEHCDFSELRAEIATTLCIDHSFNSNTLLAEAQASENASWSGSNDSGGFFSDSSGSSDSGGGGGD